MTSTRGGENIRVNIENRLILQMQKMPDPRYVLEFPFGDLPGKEHRVLRVDDGIFLAVHNYGFALDLAYIDRFG